MLAAYMYGKNDIRLKEIPIPDINDDEILLQIKCAAICGTDLRILRNGHPLISADTPRILGHEVSGVIAKAGKNLQEYHEGMCISLAPNITCGKCHSCLIDCSHLCSQSKAFGMAIDGGFAEYAVIPAEAVRNGNIFLINNDLSFEEAALLEPLSCVYHGYKRCSAAPGDIVLVIGAGPIGIMHAMLAQISGAKMVFISDISQTRLDLCKKIDGALIPVLSSQLDEHIMQTTSGMGVDVCITACPSPAMQAKALELTALNGRVLFFGGLPDDKRNVSLNTNLIHYKQLYVSGTSGSSILDYQKALDLVSSKLISLNNMITNRFSLSEISSAVKAASSSSGLKSVIVFQ
jgi:L-iditol 2-dehydrogenase